MFLPTRLPGRWSMRFVSSGLYDMPVSVCWDGERLSFCEGGKPHYVRAATVNACTDWYWHGPEYSTVPILYTLPTCP
jgi:hypothetical protein